MNEKTNRLLREVFGALKNLEVQLNRIEHKVMSMSLAVDKLTAAVAEVDTAEGAALALIKGVASHIKSIADNEGAVLAYAEHLLANARALSAAVVEATPAQPEVPTAPAA